MGGGGIVLDLTKYESRGHLDWGRLSGGGGGRGKDL